MVKVLRYVVDCAGVSVVLRQSIDIVRTAGEIIKIGYGREAGGLFFGPAYRQGRFHQRTFGYTWLSWRNVMNLAVAGRIDLKSMISHRMGISQFAKRSTWFVRKKLLKLYFIRKV